MVRRKLDLEELDAHLLYDEDEDRIYWKSKAIVTETISLTGAQKAFGWFVALATILSAICSAWVAFFKQPDPPTVAPVVERALVSSEQDLRSINSKIAIAGASRQSNIELKASLDHIEAELGAIRAKLGGSSVSLGHVAAVFSIPFGSGKVILTPNAKQMISEVAHSAGQHSRIRCDGYADRSGSVSGNMRISIRRASIVADELVRDGVPSDRISIRGYGDASPSGALMGGPLSPHVAIILQ